MENVYADIRRILNALAIIDRGFATEECREQFRSAMNTHNWQLASRIVQIEAKRAQVTHEFSRDSFVTGKKPFRGPVSSLQTAPDREEANVAHASVMEAAKALNLLAETCLEIEGTIARAVEQFRRDRRFSETQTPMLNQLAITIGRLLEVSAALERNGYIHSSFVTVGRSQAAAALDAIALSS